MRVFKITQLHVTDYFTGQYGYLVSYKLSCVVRAAVKGLLRRPSGLLSAIAIAVLEVMIMVLW